MKVLVEFKNIRQENDERDETAFQAIGLLEETENGLCLRYVEPPDADDDSTAAAVRVTVSDTKIIIERQNPTVQSRMVLEAGVQHPCRYDTLYGALDLRVVCDEACRELTAHGGRITARYRIDTPGVDAFENHMEITVKEVSE